MNPRITVISMGPGDPALLTLQAAEQLRAAKRLILRTARHPVTAWLEEQGIPFTSLDDYYDRYEDFDAMHRDMAAFLWQEAASHPLAFAVMDAAGDGAVAALRAAIPEKGRLQLLPGVPMAGAALSRVPHPAASCGRVRVLPATDVTGAPALPTEPLLITELDNPRLAVTVKLWLADGYGDETEVYFLASTVTGRGAVKRIPAYELDRQRHLDHTAAVFVPPLSLLERERYSFRDLLDVMDRLRGPEGDPWDAAQTHESLRRYMLEEAYEVAAAIDEGDADHLADELGDVLLQVAFHAGVGESHGEFDVTDITTDITRKMIRRHPAVFGLGERPATENWETMKMQERGLPTMGAMMADIPAALPSLTRAQKVQAKAARVGFDWDSPEEAFPKIGEEAEEVLEELRAGRDPLMELGDLLFSCVNVTRLCGLDAEEALHRSTEKFIRRFNAMEKRIISDGKSLKGLTLHEMDVYWEQVKTAGAQAQTAGTDPDIGCDCGAAVEPD